MGHPHPALMAPPTPSSFADDVMALGDVAGHRVLSLVGSGTYGCVLDAECVATHTRVALVSECVEVNEGEKGASEAFFSSCPPLLAENLQNPAPRRRRRPRLGLGLHDHRARRPGPPGGGVRRPPPRRAPPLWRRRVQKRPAMAANPAPRPPSSTRGWPPSCCPPTCGACFTRCPKGRGRVCWLTWALPRWTRSSLSTPRASSTATSSPTTCAWRPTPRRVVGPSYTWWILEGLCWLKEVRRGKAAPPPPPPPPRRARPTFMGTPHYAALAALTEDQPP